MREPPSGSGTSSVPKSSQNGLIHPNYVQGGASILRPGGVGPLGGPPPLPGNPNQLSLSQLQDMAMRQQHQIEAQQQMLVAKEQRLKYLRQQDFKQNQMAAEYERLRRLREKVKFKKI